MHESKLPVVSIITVVYNNRAGLESTLLNIFAQAYRAIEVIVIDGGSTDGTVDVIEQYNGQIDYWVSEKDKGLYDAMNKGLKAAMGDYVWFVNSGDYIESNDTLNNIYKQYALVDDVYYGETNFIDAEGSILGTRSELTTRKLPERLTWKTFRNGQVVSHQSFIVKRAIAPEYNLGFKISADVDWQIRCLINSKSIVNTHLVLTRYLLGGYSKAHQQKSWKERFLIFKKYYGLPQALIWHVYFVFRAIGFKLMG